MFHRQRRLTEIPTAAITLCASFAWSAVDAASPALPVPCAPAACGANGPSQFVTSGTATAVASQNALKITQATNSAILNWSSFNIGQGNSVSFQQPSSSSIALNRIFQASPSQIFGQLNANGQVYLVNLNGFVFGPNSTVNVGSLLVSSLPLALTDANFKNGILSPATANAKPVLDGTLDSLAPGGRKSVLDLQGNPVLDSQGNPIPVAVVVQPGAQLAAADQGRILLAGQKVTNGGTLTAPDGQVILAAGTQVFLEASSDPSLRGLLVEVDGTGTTDNVAWNQLTGSVSAERGNITMVGLAVNQEGRISATTSVSANGSIRLEAAGGGRIAGSSNNQVVSTQGGLLTIGPQSDIEVLPELSSKDTEVKAQPQLQSSVTLLGEQIFMKGGSITAPNGNLTAVAASNPFDTAANPKQGVSAADPNARLRVDSGTKIDLSGSQATLPVSANLVAVQLRSSELADDPTQRNGPLHGLTVYVDARNPSPPLANVSGEIAAIPQSVAQRTEQGGNAIFQSGGDLVFASGASLNVSGGSTTYTGGIMQTSYLVGTDGKLYPIATANPLLSYTGVLNPTLSQTFNKWGVKDVLPTPGLSSYQPGYVQGASAGSVQFAAPAMVLQGTLTGNAVNGIYQRTPATAVSGGQLTIGVPTGIGASASTLPIDYLSPAIQLTRNAFPIGTSDDSPLPQPLPLYLPTSYLTGSGFTSTQIYSNFDVTLTPGPTLQLPAGSTLSVNAARINILSSVTDPGGSLNFQNVQSLGTAAVGAARSGVFVSDAVSLDVSGLWTNDMPLSGGTGVTQTWQNGGQVNIGVSSPGALLSIGNGVTLTANGGAWMTASGALNAGKGGTISLVSDGINTGFDVGNQLSIQGFGVQGAAGGTFNLTAPRVEIGSANGNWTAAQQVDDTILPGAFFRVGTNLFSDYGFQKFNLNASGLVATGASSTNVLSMDSGTAASAVVSPLYLRPAVSLFPSANNVDSISSVRTLTEYQRAPASITLSALPSQSAATGIQIGSTTAGDINIGSGASITTDAGGAIALSSLDSIVVDGALRAPGGNVSLQIVSPAANNGAYAQFEAGFLPQQRIDLGPTGTIDVSGTFVTRPSTLSLTLGTLYSGGTVNLFADRGAVVAEAGSVISVAGSTAPVDVLQFNNTYAHELASSSGGSVVARSGEAIFLAGTLDASGGTGGTTGPAAGGLLEVDLTRSESWWGVTGSAAVGDSFNNGPLDIRLVSQAPALVGVPSPLFGSNEAILGAANLAQTGIDALRIEAGDSITLSGTVALGMNRSIVLDAAAIAATPGSQAKLSAPYLEVGYSLSGGSTPTNSKAALPGTGVVQFTGAEVDLVGSTVFQGISDARFASSGDLLLRGTGSTSLQGGIAVAGSATLDAARIYPASGTAFAINATEPVPGSSTSSITIGQSGTNPGTPFSVGGSFTASADNINSTGTIYAPFGAIQLSATNSLTLGDGSLTSVSGTGLMLPYGQTSFGGQQWLYVNQTPVNGVPARTVSLNAPTVTLTKQANINLTGGGELFAYEWVPGSGGTHDQLGYGANTTTIPGLYAVLPSTRGQVSPQDPLYSAGAPIGAGESVYLSGIGGLAAGTYPLLPARYALVPGAYLIQIEPGMVSSTAGSMGALLDGTPVVAGYLSYGSTGLHQTPGYVGFAVYPGSYGGQLAEYDLSLASKFFSTQASLAGKARPVLPADAGALLMSVSGALNAAGQVQTAAASGGLGASIEISANDLVVGAASGPVPQDAVTIQGSVLQSWQPGSLILGGTITPAASSGSGSSPAPASSTINVLANSVTIGSDTSLTADQIVLVASQSIDVQSGAQLQSTSAAAGKAPAILPKEQQVALNTTSGGGAAMVAVSDLNWLTPATATTAGATVSVESGASIKSHGSLAFEGPGGLTLNGTLSGSGAEWVLGSSSIAFVPSGSHADAFSIDPGLLSQMGSASAVKITSAGAIDLTTPVIFGIDSSGTTTLGALTLSAASLNNQAGAGTTQFGARTLTLNSNTSSAVAGAPGSSGANLLLTAGQLDLGPGSLAVNGFSSTQANVSGAVVGQGSGRISVGGDLKISAAGLTAKAGEGVEIDANGALVIAPSNGNTAKVPDLLGGELILSGDSVEVAGLISVPSGVVAVKSTGGDVTIDGAATITTAGQRIAIGNQTGATPGGRIAVSSAGNLTLATGATFDVSGAGTATGGALSLASVGATALSATLKGASSGSAGGSFSLDAGALSPAAGSAANPLTGIAAALGAGGFNQAIDLRVRTGDVSLDAGSALSANELSVTADSGFVSIGGQLNAASSGLRGSVSVFGGKGVELLAGGGLHAHGSGASGIGGTIEIGAGHLTADPITGLYSYNTAAIQLDRGSTISATGAAGNGTLLLRAPALQATNDVAIQPILSDTSGIGRILIEPVLPITTSAANLASDLPNAQNTVSSYMSLAASNIANRLASANGTALFVVPGVELIAVGPLALPVMDLSGWRFNDGSGSIDAPIDLTVRSSGDITVSGTISDGFGGTARQPNLLTGPSSSIRLIAGADLSSANPLSNVAGTGTLTIGPGSVVRTGTGDIDLVAGQDIVIAAAGSGAYTAGVPAIAPGGSAADPYAAMPTKFGTDVGYGITIGTNLLSLPSGGGNLTVKAGGNIVGAALNTPGHDEPGVSNWQLREGANSALQTLPMWGVNLAKYDWNFGTLGGGDLNISAGHDAVNVTAAAADSLLPQYGGATQFVTSGGLSFKAGHDIGSAEVFLADGSGVVSAGGALTAVLTPSGGGSGPNVGSAFFLQSSSLDVTARLGIAADGIFNPTTLPQLVSAKPLPGAFLSYADSSSVTMQSVSGDIDMGLADNAAATLLGVKVNNGINTSFVGALPPTLAVQAFGGGIHFGPGFEGGKNMVLTPSSTGQLDLLAAGDIASSLPGGSTIIMSDAAPGSFATVSSPFASIPIGSTESRFVGNDHGADPNPALVTAGGSIQDLILSIPKAAQIVAGQDITDTQYYGQNLNPTDLTLLSAGRDLSFSLGDLGGISVGGPGGVEVLAGRTVTLGVSSGVVTTGNLLNANLPTSQGADLTIVTGLASAPDYSGFVSSVIAPSHTYQTQLINYVEALNGVSNLSFASAEAIFSSLAPARQQPLVDQVFFNELLLSGRAYTLTPAVGFTQGYKAIDALFPGSRTASAGGAGDAYAGDLSLAFSQIYTLSGGNINLVVPGGIPNGSPAGRIDVGLANPPTGIGINKPPSTLGIVAEGPGNVNIYAKGDVNVNASRIFTLGGGNILVVSDEGNIDAGRGAKTAVSAPPPTILINSDGTVSLNFSGAASGSGIRTIQTEPSQPLGSVDLIAPVGIVNAGDAGIGAAGNINVASRAVVGLSNISFGGTATGVPAEVSNVGATVSGASSAASGATSGATGSPDSTRRPDQTGTAPISQSVLGWLDVFVTGLGEENCKPDDMDCLKRQKSGPK